MKRRTLFHDDVRIEDVDPDPFQRFGGEQISRPPHVVPSQAASPTSATAVPRRLEMPPGPNPMMMKKASIFSSPSADEGQQRPPGTTATTRRQVMMINTDLAVGHEKTLKSTIEKKSSNVHGNFGALRESSVSSLTREKSGTVAAAASGDLSKGSNNSTSGAGMAHDQGPSRQVPRISTLRRLPRPTRNWHRFSRTIYQWCVVFSVILSFAASAAATASGYWVVRKDTLNEIHHWKELTMFAGPCDCASNFDFTCSTLGNGFAQVSQMSALLIGVELLLLGTLLFEFSFYGIFGGTHFFTRLTLISEVMGFATASLTLILYVMSYQTSYCDFKSFKDRGYSLGWAAYLRGLESLGFFGMLVLTANAGFGSSRGPPCSLLFVGSLLFAMTCVSTTTYGWMTFGQDTLYGITAHCICGSSCSPRSDFSSLLQSTRGLTLFQTILGVLTLFFVLLRGVDNAGATLKFAEISGALFIGVAAANVGNLYRLDFDADCRIPGQEDMYVPSYGLYAIAGSAGTMFVFLILNGLYMTRFFVHAIEEIIVNNLPRDSPWHDWALNQKSFQEERASLPAPFVSATKLVKGVITKVAKPGGDDGAPGSPTGGGDWYRTGPFAAVGPRTFYQVFWWDELMSDGAIQAEELEENLMEEFDEGLQPEQQRDSIPRDRKSTGGNEAITAENNFMNETEHEKRQREEDQRLAASSKSIEAVQIFSDDE